MALTDAKEISILDFLGEAKKKLKRKGHSKSHGLFNILIFYFSLAEHSIKMFPVIQTKKKTAGGARGM